MCTQRIGGSGLEAILFPLFLFLRGLSRHRQFYFLLREQAKKHLALGFVRLPFKQMAKVLDVEVRHRPVHGELHRCASDASILKLTELKAFTTSAFGKSAPK